MLCWQGVFVTAMRRWVGSEWWWWCWEAALMKGVALWCNSLAAVLWNSMKAEITRTRLVEQPSTEQPQSQIVSDSHTFTPADAGTCILLCFSFSTPFSFLIFFPFLISLTLLWHRWNPFEQLCVLFFFKLRSLVQFLIFPFFFPLHSLCLLSLLSSMCWFFTPSPMHARSLKPLCSMSPLTTAVTLWP